MRIDFPRLVVGLCVSLACAFGAGCAATPPPATGSRAESVQFVANGGQVFDGVIERPAAEAANGWAALLIGGGLGNDLDWTVPGVMEIDGTAHQITPSGEPHSDALALSAALTAEGFAVMRWSTLARGDPLAEAWPARATPRTPAELLEQARAALTALRSSDGGGADKVLLVGHSLGAARAWTIAATDPGIRALVLLSPAYFLRLANPPASFVGGGMQFGEEALRQRVLPSLFVFGELESSRAVDLAGVQAHFAREDLPEAQMHVLPGLGHQLGRQEGTLIGPVEEDVLELIAHWAGRVASSESGD